MEKHFPNISSEFADEGTLAHSLLESCINNGLNAIDYLYWTQIDFDTEDHMMGWADYITNKRNLPAVDYVSQNLGPVLAISRQETFDTLFDEFDALIETLKDDNEKAQKGIADAYEKVQQNTFKDYSLDGVDWSIKECKKFVKVVTNLGSRVMRDYPLLSQMAEVMGNHITNTKADQ